MKMLALIVFVGLVSAGAYIANSERDAIEVPIERKPEHRSQQNNNHNHKHTRNAPMVTDTFIPGNDRSRGAVPGVLERMAGAPTAGAATRKMELPNFGDLEPDQKIGDVDRDRFRTSTRLDGTRPFEPHRTSQTADLRQAATPQDLDRYRSMPGSRKTPEGKYTGPAAHVPAAAGTPPIVPRDTASSRRLQPLVRVPGASAAVSRNAMIENYSAESCSKGSVEATLPHAASVVPRGTSTRGYEIGNRTEHCAPAAGNAGQFGSYRPRQNDLDAFGIDCGRGGGEPDPGILGHAHSPVLGARGVMTRNQITDTFINGGDTGRPLDPTTKELMLDVGRSFGNLQQVTPTKAEVYDPRHQMRTTLKETAVHDTGEGWIGGSGAGQSGHVRSPLALAKPTGRQTLAEPEETRGALTGTNVVFKAPVYDPDDIFRTTARETTAQDDYVGHPGTLERASRGSEPEIDTTQRELWTGERFGNAAVPRSDGYASSKAEARSTGRQCFDDSAQFRPGAATPQVEREPANEALHRVIGDVKESVLRQRYPTPRRETLVQNRLGQARVPAQRVHVPRIQSRQDQNRTQGYVRVGCESDTRGVNRLASDTLPREFVIDQLRSNPYVTKTRI